MERNMWCLTWVLGLGFAVALGILNGAWYEFSTSDDPDAENPDKV
jgi:cytochrome bd-I ubiquinol oxidase subunit X